MDDATIHERIEHLVAEEHELWRREAEGEIDDATTAASRTTSRSRSTRPGTCSASARPCGRRTSIRTRRSSAIRRPSSTTGSSSAVILDNGVVRTLDPSLPTCGALAIAGPLVAGGVGTHEWALPTPERVDLAGRCVLPAFTDSHVHFPTWALARTRRSPRGGGFARRGTGARRSAPTARHLDPRHRLARRGVARSGRPRLRSTR